MQKKPTENTTISNLVNINRDNMCRTLLNTYLNDITGSIVLNIRVLDIINHICVIFLENLCFYKKTENST